MLSLNVKGSNKKTFWPDIDIIYVNIRTSTRIPLVSIGVTSVEMYASYMSMLRSNIECTFEWSIDTYC